MAAFPAPTEEQAGSSKILAGLIQQAINEAGGAIGFDQFMAMSLYQPGYGYYSAGSQKFGAEGDFITSPEVSPMFAQCLARQVADVFSQLENQSVIEFGAGSGILAADLLRELQHLQALPEEYCIIEVSAELQQRQRETLEKCCPDLLPRVSWLQQLPLAKKQAVVIANEVLDAMPVTVFEKSDGQLFEATVSLHDNVFSWSHQSASDGVKRAVEKIEQSIERELADDYRSEFNAAVQPWINSLSQMLEKGLVLLIDYGYDARQYYNEERTQGTLMCYYRHRAHDDVFYYPGLQDITAFVDFTAVAEAAVDASLDVLGYTNQAQFLFGCGLPEIFETKMAACEDDVKQQMHLSQQVKTLTLPGEMGERFKVMALGKDIEPGLSGFSIADFRTRL